MFVRIWCYGGTAREGEDDFVVRYDGPSGIVIEVIYAPLGNAVLCYRVMEHEFRRFVDAKRYAMSLI